MFKSNRPAPHCPSSLTAVLAVFLLLVGCATPRPDRAVAAQQLFAAAVKAHGDRQFTIAAAGYQQVLRDYRDQPGWCAQALRSLGNVRAAQDRLDEAVKLYRQVGEDYGEFDWEVLQAWKSAADLLHDAGRTKEAQQFDRQIVKRFDRPDAPAVYKSIVKACQARLKP